MTSRMPGVATFPCEITAINPLGFWLLIDDAEYFVPFGDYPVFKSASLDQIFAFERLGPGQLYWPALDADIELAALREPERYPLVFQPKGS